MKELKKLEKLFLKGKISRRQFLAYTAALGLTTAISPMLVPTPADAATPKKGGRFRVGLTEGSNSEVLDPAMLVATMATNLTFGQLRNCLVEIDHNNLAKPELAESWEASKDAKKWVVNLRKGIEFHDGKTMDATDVIFSYNHHTKKDSKSGAKPLVKPIVDIRADGKYKVLFTLEDGNADFPYVMSDYHLQIVPAGTKYFDKGIGTGGYMLVNHKPGVGCLTKRNPNYWKEGQAHFDEIEMLNIEDPFSRINALKGDQVDLISKCDPKFFSLLKKTPGLQGIEFLTGAHYTFPMLTNNSPFNNNDVRLALKYSIDREQLVKQVLRGNGQLGNDHPIPSTSSYYNSELQQRKFDPDKAKYYMKKAGLEGYVFNLHAADGAYPGAVDVSVLYKEQAARCGININVKREPNEGYWSNVWRKKLFSACYWYGRPTPDMMFSTIYAGDAPWNDTNFQHERFDKLLIEARKELDEKKRREMYWEMQRIVRDKGGTIIWGYPTDLSAASEKVKFGKLSQHKDLDGLKCYERWWFES